MAPPSGDTHVLIIRAWVEPLASSNPLRIRILELRGPSDAGTTLAMAVSAEEACGVVRDWLQQLAGPGHPPT